MSHRSTPTRLRLTGATVALTALAAGTVLVTGVPAARPAPAPSPRASTDMVAAALGPVEPVRAPAEAKLTALAVDPPGPAPTATPPAPVPSPTATSTTPNADSSKEDAGDGDVQAAAADDPEPASQRTWTGVASWYGDDFAGQETASGEPFDPDALTAAHKTLELGSRVRVTSLRTGESVVVRINDRGPYVEGREIDLSRAAAERIGVTDTGTGDVRLELLG